MILSPLAREFYRVAITTDGDVTDWEASFDGGTTWHDGEVDPDEETFTRWLLAGPDAPLGTAVAVITADVVPIVRATDNPEIVVRKAPRITLDR